MKPRQISSRIGAVGIVLAVAFLGVSTRGYGQVRIPNAIPQIDQQAEAAYRAFTNEGNPDTKIQLGEEFEQKYPSSRYQKVVGSILVTLYYGKENWAKFYATAVKVIAKDPDNVPILELVGWAIPRQYNAADPSEPMKLDESEKYEKRALRLITAMKKPKAVTTDQFNNAQASLAWRAHSGLGMTYFRRKDFANSVKELQTAVAEESPEPDPVDLYVLGLDLHNLNRTSEAVDVFTKCAQISGDMQDLCKRRADTAKATVDPAEEGAYAAFKAAPNSDAKIELGEEFDQKYPASRYEETVDSTLIALYAGKQSWDKFYAAADKVVAKDPDNVPVLVLVGWVIPRNYDADNPDEAAKLDECERYEKHALDLIAAMQKPAQLTDDQFNQASANAASQAHSGLGMMYFRRKDYADSARELQLAMASVPEADALDFYALGVDLQKLNRAREAADAFTSCSRMLGVLQAQCKKDADVVMEAAAPATAALVPQTHQGGPQTPEAKAQLTAANGESPNLPRPSVPDIRPPSAQESAPALKVETILVPVRVVVRDNKGRAVENLQEEDFNLYQDKKQQQIATFASITEAGDHPPAGASSVAAPAFTVPTGSNAPAATPVLVAGRFVALFFDDVHLYFADLAQTRAAAEKYLSSLQPADRVAIVTASGQGEADFTGDREKLSETLRKLQPHPLPGGVREEMGDSACPPMTYTEAAAIDNDGSAPVLSIAAKDVMRCGEALSMEMAEGIARAVATETQIAGEEATDAVFQSLQKTVRRLSARPGQRIVVLVSPGFIYGSHQAQFAEITNLAIRYNVVVNTLDAKGVYLDEGKWDPDRFRRYGYGHEVEDSVLEDLADSTGGLFVHGNNDFKGVLAEMSKAPEAYYLLAYAPQNLQTDGQYHILKVSLAAGLRYTVQARRGFYAPSQLETPEEAATREINDAAFSDDEQHGLPVKMKTLLEKAPEGGTKLDVTADLDVANLHFLKTNGANQEAVTIVATLFDSDGNYVAGTKKILTMKYDDASLTKLSETGAKVDFDFEVKAGSYVVRLVARDSNDEHVSAENAAVTVPN